MSGVVVVAGRFEPGTVVRLVRVEDESVLRGEYGELVSERVVDADGAVGWDGLDVGASYFAQGYVDGGYLELRCRGVDASEPQGSLSQPPVPPAEGTLGTGNAPNVEAPPAPPVVEEGEEPLPEGLPDGVSLSELGVKTYYLHNGDEPASADWRKPELQTPAETAADGTALDARPLYEWVGDGEPDLGVGTGERPEWEAYEGATEPAGTTPAQSTLTDTSGQPPVEAQPDVPPAAEPAAPAEEPQQPSEVQVAPPTAPAAGEAVPVSVEGEVKVSPPAPAAEPPAPTDGAAQPDSPAEPAPVEATDGGAPATSSDAAPAPAEAAAPAAPVEEAAAEPQPAQPADGGAGDAGSAPAPPVPAPEAPPESPAPEAPAEGAPEAAPAAEKGQ